MTYSSNRTSTVKSSMTRLLVVGIFAGLVFSGNVYACDEACERAKAEQALDKTFPGYLSWKMCDDTRQDFMNSAMKSIRSYKDKHFDTRYKKGMRNMKNFVEQRHEWLQECDEYYRYTNKGRMFEDKETTEKVFAALNAVSKELNDLINGVTYSVDPGEDENAVIMSRFNTLLTTVDDHRTLMHLKGRYVYR